MMRERGGLPPEGGKFAGKQGKTQCIKQTSGCNKTREKESRRLLAHEKGLLSTRRSWRAAHSRC
ncbi:uncharacterized protein P884DRAFT_260471 [Thermothelomyces heterothallicus CBS 202.75]|uniref:uncharacterized protein n=1 Tax=Thermothelomyces heterothallicus CBS 202.75 TaxID=1149848 RepID=UPI003744378E